jgi:hypothetical protein
MEFNAIAIDLAKSSLPRKPINPGPCVNAMQIAVLIPAFTNAASITGTIFC